ncbi:DUF6248 family natural product biosynthesis protein [Streptomyces sp. NPDC001089]
MIESEAGEPTPKTCLRVAREAAELAVAAADHATNAVCRSRSGNIARLEEAANEAHREAVEAERHAVQAERWAADPSVPDRSLRYCASQAVDRAVRAQGAAGVEATAAALRTELERRLSPEERAERESKQRREEAKEEAEERAATGMDSDNRDLAHANAYLAESAVSELGWAAGHQRVLEAAETGRLYQLDEQVRQAAERGVWSGGRKISRERTQDLLTAGFLTAATADGVRRLTPTPMGQVALELTRLHPAGLYESDKAAYEARYARVAKRHQRSDDKKAAAHRLPPLDPTALRLYRRPVTLAEQELRAEREAAEQWEDEGGYCPGVPTPVPAAAAEPAATPVKTEPTLPSGMYFLPLPSTRHRDWWTIQCGRCQGGIRTELPGEWHDKDEAAQAAREHYDDAHRPVDDLLTEEEVAEVERWPLSDAQRTVLSHAEHADLAEFDDGFWALDCVPDRWDVNKRVARGRVTGLWAAGLLDVRLDGNGRRQLVKSPTGHRVARLLFRAERQGIAEPAAKDAKLAPLAKRSGGYPLQSEGRYFKGEKRPAAEPAPEAAAPLPAAAPKQPAAAADSDQPLLRRLFAPRVERPAYDVRTVIRRPQRVLTPEERERARNTRLLNLEGALIMGITDPVANPSPMPEEAGARVREEVWPERFKVIERKYPQGFARWSMCERGTCWNCLAGRCDICVHRQKGGPDVDRNLESVTNHRGHAVAKFIPRPGGEPCVWWCRCPCPKDGPAPARPAAKPKAAPPAAAVAPVPAATSAQASEPEAAQAALW